MSERKRERERERENERKGEEKRSDSFFFLADKYCVNTLFSLCSDCVGRRERERRRKEKRREEKRREEKRKATNVGLSLSFFLSFPTDFHQNAVFHGYVKAD
jgi:hypothetical protein